MFHTPDADQFGPRLSSHRRQSMFSPELVVQYILNMLNEPVRSRPRRGSRRLPVSLDRLPQHWISHALDSLQEPCRAWPRRHFIKRTSRRLTQLAQVEGIVRVLRVSPQRVATGDCRLLKLRIVSGAQPLLTQAKGAPVLQVWLPDEAGNPEAKPLNPFAQLVARIGRVNWREPREAHAPSLSVESGTGQGATTR